MDTETDFGCRMLLNDDIQSENHPAIRYRPSLDLNQVRADERSDHRRDFSWSQLKAFVPYLSKRESMQKGVVVQNIYPSRCSKKCRWIDKISWLCCSPSQYQKALNALMILESSAGSQRGKSFVPLYRSCPNFFVKA